MRTLNLILLNQTTSPAQSLALLGDGFTMFHRTSSLLGGHKSLKEDKGGCNFGPLSLWFSGLFKEWWKKSRWALMICVCCPVAAGSVSVMHAWSCTAPSAPCYSIQPASQINDGSWIWGIIWNSSGKTKERKVCCNVFHPCQCSPAPLCV